MLRSLRGFIVFGRRWWNKVGVVSVEKSGTTACICFTAASEFSNFPDPAWSEKAAHNSQRFLMKTLLRQCSLVSRDTLFLIAGSAK